MKTIVKKHTNEVKPLYYSFKWILSKNRLISCVMGIRGGGKTFDATSLVINRFVRKGYKTIWMRRLATEIDDFFLDKFFVDMELNDVFPNYEFKVERTEIDGVAYGCIRKKTEDKKGKYERFILFMPLSIALKHKSVALSEYNLVIGDEWFIDTMNSNLRYLKGWNEPYIFNEFFESVARKRNDVRALFISNAISSVNPYFVEWGVKIDNDTEWWMNDFVVVHNYKNETYKKEKLQTQWGKFIANSKYGKYNMDNEFLNDSDTFIEVKSKESKWICNLVYAGKTMAIWVDEPKSKVYIATAIQPNGRTYCFSGEDLKPNMFLIDSAKSNTNPISNLIKNAYKHAYLYYENQEVKQKMYELLGVFKV